MATITLKDAHDLQVAGVREGNPQKVHQATEMLESIIAAYPDEWPPLLYLANAYLYLQRYGLAVPLFHRIIELMGPFHETYNNLGTCYRNLNKADKARVVLEKADQINPNDPDILNNLGTLHINEGSPEEAEKYLRRAMAVKPDHPQSHWNMALSLLEQEKWAEGFREYQWGLTGKDRMRKDYGYARWWHGEPVKDDTIVVYGEQGVGDELMYATMIPDMRELAGHLIFDCHPRLINVFQRTFPGLELHPTRKIFHEPLAWAQGRNIQWKSAIGDIGAYLRTVNSDFPRVPYLVVDRTLIEMYKAELRKLPPPYVGLAWTGGVRKTRKELRSLPLMALGPFAQLGTAISLQYKDDPEEVEAFTKATGLTVHRFPDIFDSKRSEKYYPLINGERIKNEKGEDSWWQDKAEAKHFMQSRGLKVDLELIHEKAFDYEHTLAFLRAIHELGGCVVSVNTTVVHACGSAGVRCMVLTPSKPAWRYGVSQIAGKRRRGMIWYSEDYVTQFRQIENDWKPALEACLAETIAYLANPYG